MNAAHDSREIEMLIVGHFDGSLTPDQERELAAAMANSKDTRQVFLSYMRMEGRLHSMGQDGLLGEPVDLENPDAVETFRYRQHQNRYRLIRAFSSLAAGLLIIIAISWALYPESVNANNLLQKARQAAAKLVDRTYLLVISEPISDMRTKREFEIDMRGDGKFLVQPKNEMYTMGCDGTDFWLVRKNSSRVAVARDFKVLSPELKKRIPNPGVLQFMMSPQKSMVLDLPSLLQHIDSYYDVELRDSNETDLQHLRATPRRSKKASPKFVDLWIDVETGVLVRVKMTKPNRRTATLELIETKPLAEHWYQYKTQFPNHRVESLTR